MILWLVLSIYAFAKNRPMQGILFYSLAYSVKGAALLMLPALLGMLMHNYSLLVMMVNSAFIVIFQVALSLPFTWFGDTTITDYLRRSKLTGAGSAGILGKPAEFDWLTSQHFNSIFWKMFTEDQYNLK